MYNNEQIDKLLEEEKIEQPQTVIFNKLTGALVAKMFGDHMDLVNTKYCKGKVKRTLLRGLKESESARSEENGNCSMQH